MSDTLSRVEKSAGKISKCLLCGNEGRLLYQNLQDWVYSISGSYDFIQCPQCGLVWSTSRIAFSNISECYESQPFYTRDIRLSDNTSCLRNLKRRVKDIILSASFGYTHLEKHQKFFGKCLSLVWPIRKRVEESIMGISYISGGKLLDIGCGGGQFLYNMQRLGWDVFGVEIDRKAVKVAQEFYKLRNIYSGTLEEVKFPSDTFDVITMFHVIEHTENPITTFIECHRILKPTGKLIVITPNIKSLGHYLFKKNYFSLFPPYHFYLFSPSTIRRCVEKAGLTILKLKTLTRQAHYVYACSVMVQKLGKCPGGFSAIKSKKLLIKGLVFKFVENILNHIFSSNKIGRAHV